METVASARRTPTSRSSSAATTLTYVVTALEQDRLITWKGENKTVISDDTIRLTPSGSGTEVTYVAEFTFKGPAKYLGLLMTPAVNRLGDKTQETLRDALIRL
ncbi:MAG: hypothetical protein M3445_08820 [Actinomycetota bacterium]|nr:hypothetical protein [Actinomycetota bacterium]